MLYGYLNSLSTIVAAASTAEEYTEWFAGLKEEPGLLNKYRTDFMEHLTDDDLHLFHDTVFVFDFKNKEAQDAFTLKHELLINTVQRAADKNKDMLDFKRPDIYDPNDERTLAEILGLTKEDRYDHRTDEQKERDLEEKTQMDALRKDGKISDDSFSPAKKTGTHVTDIRVTTNADGSVSVDNVLGVQIKEGETNDKPVYPTK